MSLPFRRNWRRGSISAALMYLAWLLSPASDVDGVVFLSPPRRLQHGAYTSGSPEALPARPAFREADSPNLVEKQSLGQASLPRGPGSGEDKDDEEDNEFNLNLGRALDYLAEDVPQMFSAPPRLGIFTQDVVLKGSKSRQKVMRLYKRWRRPSSKQFIKPPYSISRTTAIDSECCRLPTTSVLSNKRTNYAPTSFDQQDPVGELCHGRRLYGVLHSSLRVLSAVTAATPRVRVTSLAFNKDRSEIELKWTMIASAPLIGEDAVKISAVSVYRIDERGLIYEHAIDNRIKRDLWEHSHSWMGVLVSGGRPPSS